MMYDTKGKHPWVTWNWLHEEAFHSCQQESEEGMPTDLHSPNTQPPTSSATKEGEHLESLSSYHLVINILSIQVYAQVQVTYQLKKDLVTVCQAQLKKTNWNINYAQVFT